MSNVKGMSVQERYDDICEISGMSEGIVRRVLDAERESIIKSLKNGERATLIGRCTIVPEIRSKIEIGGQRRTFIKLKPDISSSLVGELEKVGEFSSNVESTQETEPNVRVRQISALI